jgi:hypothetical protein
MLPHQCYSQLVVLALLWLCVMAGLRQQLAVYHAYENFCLPHTSLRLPLPQPELTNGTVSAKTCDHRRLPWPLG